MISLISGPGPHLSPRRICEATSLHIRARMTRVIRPAQIVCSIPQETVEKENDVAKVTGEWADRYREQWKWDSVSWGSHSVDCYPGGCPFRVYVRDGKILREEQAGIASPVEPGTPDMNPMGCQKGACWSH